MRFSHNVILGILGAALVVGAVADLPNTGRTLSDLGDRLDDLETQGASRTVGDVTVGGGLIKNDDDSGIGGAYVKKDDTTRAIGGVSTDERKNIVVGENDSGTVTHRSFGGRRLSGLDLEGGSGSRQIGDATVGGGYLIGDRNGAIGGYVERDGEYRGVAGFDVGDKTVGVRGSLAEDGLHLKKVGGNGRRLSGLNLEGGSGSRQVGDATVGGGYLIGDRNGAIGGYVERDGEYRGVAGFDVGDKTVGVRGSLGEDGLHLKKVGGNGR